MCTRVSFYSSEWPGIHCSPGCPWSFLQSYSLLRATTLSSQYQNAKLSFLLSTGQTFKKPLTIKPHCKQMQKHQLPPKQSVGFLVILFFSKSHQSQRTRKDFANREERRWYRGLRFCQASGARRKMNYRSRASSLQSSAMPMTKI